MARLSVPNLDDPKEPLGSRLARRFALFGLDEEIPELRGQPPDSGRWISTRVRAYDDPDAPSGGESVSAPTEDPVHGEQEPGEGE